MGVEKTGKGFGPTIHEETSQIRRGWYHGLGCGDAVWGWKARAD